MNIINRIDKLISNFFRNFTNVQTNQTICRVTAHLGDLTLHLLILPFLYAMGNFKIKESLKILIIGTIKVILILLIMKSLFKRKRPVDNLPKEYSLVSKNNKFSFPSGHSLRNFLIAESIGNDFKKLKPLLYIYATLNGLSRIALGLHYPTDVIVGALIGISVGRKNR